MALASDPGASDTSGGADTSGAGGESVSAIGGHGSGASTVEDSGPEASVGASRDAHDAAAAVVGTDSWRRHVYPPVGSDLHRDREIQTGHHHFGWSVPDRGERDPRVPDVASGADHAKRGGLARPLRPASRVGARVRHHDLVTEHPTPRVTVVRSPLGETSTRSADRSTRTGSGACRARIASNRRWAV